MQDIADRIGCARNTVSMALRGSTRISLKMRERVAREAARMEYIPNLAARNLKTQRSGLIGIYATSAQDDVRVSLINSLVTDLHTTHYRPILGIADSPAEEWSTSPWLQSFMALNVEALVVVAQAIDEGSVSIFKQLPTIVIGCEPDTRLADADCVALDRKEAGRLGAEHLLANGHKRVCVAPRTSGFSTGSLAALRRAELRPCGPVFRTPASLDATERICDRILAAESRPTAVLLGDSPMAARLIHALLQRGLRVPEDMAVLGYDYFAWADHLKVPLNPFS